MARSLQFSTIQIIGFFLDAFLAQAKQQNVCRLYSAKLEDVVGSICFPHVGHILFSFDFLNIFLQFMEQNPSSLYVGFGIFSNVANIFLHCLHFTFLVCVLLHLIEQYPL